MPHDSPADTFRRTRIGVWLVTAMALLLLVTAAVGARAFRDRQAFIASLEQAVRESGASGERFRDLLVVATTAHQESTLIELAGLSLMLAVALWAVLTWQGSVQVPLARLKEAALRLQSGDLSYRIAVPRNDDWGVIATAFHTLAERLEQSRAALRGLSTHDPVTGLLNRRAFMARLHAEVDRSARYDHELSLCLVDLDNFEPIAKAHGEQTAQKILQTAALILTQAVRSVDVVGYHGSERFLVCLPETGGTRAAVVARRLFEQLTTEPITLGGTRSIQLSVSVGAATSSELAGTGDTLLIAAERALEGAKQLGGNRVRWHRRTL